ncbi:hypothetical protein DSECCO2_247600 [anaerobic digester metagenome]
MEFPDELQSKLLECPPEVIAYLIHLHEVIESLEFRIKDLESRLNLNSSNSGKPPLSDVYARKNRKREGDQKKNLKVNLGIKEKPSNKVPIQIISNFINLMNVPYVVIPLKEAKSLELKNARFLIYLPHPNLRYLNINQFQSVALIVEQKIQMIFLNM